MTAKKNGPPLEAEDWIDLVHRMYVAVTVSVIRSMEEILKSIRGDVVQPGGGKPEVFNERLYHEDVEQTNIALSSGLTKGLGSCETIRTFGYVQKKGLGWIQTQ